WGGDYSGSQDAMHYEYMGSVADAAEDTDRAHAAGLGGNTPKPPADWFDDVTKDEMLELLRPLQAAIDQANWGINSDQGTRVMVAANTDLHHRTLAAADQANWGINDPDQGTRAMIAGATVQAPPSAP